MRSIRDIHLSCSPDADDLFMMRALLEERIHTGRYRFHIGTSPTDALNQVAASGTGPEVIALSIAHYPAVAKRYQLLPHGGSMGEGYGPVLVSRRPRSLDSLQGAVIGVPGTSTTAWQVLSWILEARPSVVPISPYARIFEALRAGEIEAGLIIHEGRLTYEEEGSYKVLDIGEWWQEQTGLPLPLGGNAIRRDLPLEERREISGLLRASIAHALQHREEAIAWLLAREGPLDTRERVSRYLDMYANERTLDYGEAGRAGIRELLRRLGHDEPIDFSP